MYLIEDYGPGILMTEFLGEDGKGPNWKKKRLANRRKTGTTKRKQW